jgi:hypothetical protein
MSHRDVAQAHEGALATVEEHVAPRLVEATFQRAGNPTGRTHTARPFHPLMTPERGDSSDDH